MRVGEEERGRDEEALGETQTTKGLRFPSTSEREREIEKKRRRQTSQQTGKERGQRDIKQTQGQVLNG